MSGNEQPAGPGAAAPDERGGPAEPITPSTSSSAGAPPSRSGGARRLGSALTSRSAGWVAAAALAGAIVAVSVTGLITPSAAQIAVRAPLGAARQVYVGPGGGRVRVIGPQGPVLVVPGRGNVQEVIPGGPFGGMFGAPFGRVVAGTVSSVSSSGFTITTGPGQKVTVVEQPSTTYRKAGSPTSASAVARGVTVAVLGSLSGSKFTATVVAVLPAGAGFFPGAPG